MQVNPIEISFPCPACGIRLTILQTMADGPCPHCHVPIQVELKTGMREPELATREEQTVKNTFERRRFRPATHASKTGTPAHRRLSDC